MAIEGALPMRGFGALDMRPDLGHDGGAECHVRDEVPVHDVDVEPALCNERLGSGLQRGTDWGGGCEEVERGRRRECAAVLSSDLCATGSLPRSRLQNCWRIVLGFGGIPVCAIANRIRAGGA